MKYIIPYRITSYRDAKRPLNIPHEGYVVVRADNLGDAVVKIHKEIKPAHTVEVSKAIEIPTIEIPTTDMV